MHHLCGKLTNGAGSGRYFNFIQETPAANELLTPRLSFQASFLIGAELFWERPIRETQL